MDLDRSLDLEHARTQHLNIAVQIARVTVTNHPTVYLETVQVRGIRFHVLNVQKTLTYNNYSIDLIKCLYYFIDQANITFASLILPYTHISSDRLTQVNVTMYLLLNMVYSLITYFFLIFLAKMQIQLSCIVVDGGFSDWSQWTGCTLTCGTGSSERDRDCTNPAPQHGGAVCSGDTDDTRTCNTHNCPSKNYYESVNDTIIKSINATYTYQPNILNNAEYVTYQLQGRTVTIYGVVHLY